MKISWLTVIALLAFQKLSTVLPTSTAIIMAPATRTSDPYEGRFKHIVTEWLRGDRFIVNALKEKNITEYLQLVRLLENPDEVNALNNRTGKDDEEEIDVRNSERLRYCLSLINDLQLQFGPILEDELVDISTNHVMNSISTVREGPHLP